MTHYNEQLAKAVASLRKTHKEKKMNGFLTEKELLEDLDSQHNNVDFLAPLVSDKELDPNGIDQHAPGAKLDAGKVRPGLVLGDFSNALLAVSEVGTFGANKYTDHGWLEVENGVNRYKDAMQRHLLKHNTGELIDDETNLTHLAAVAWNVLAMLELTIREGKE